MKMPAEREPPLQPRFKAHLLASQRLMTFFMDDIEDRAGMRVEWETTFDSFEVDESKVNDETSFPVTAKVSAGGSHSTVRAKYMIGCDGGHSLIRRMLGYEMVGETRDAVFGVIEVIPITDFPDARRVGFIRAHGGCILQIPRERRYVRYYVELDDVQFDSAGRVIRSGVTPESILARIQTVLYPYKVSYKPGNLQWWTVYQIGQRVSTSMSFKDRVFLAGDSVHTHSPKAGQGMNCSMGDTYNLGWKLGLVLRGLTPAMPLLGTYEQERLKYAKELIEFDTKHSQLFSGKPIEELMKMTGFDVKDVRDAFRKNAEFISNLGIKYDDSVITTGATSKQQLAKNIHLGVRMPSTPVVNHSDMFTIELGRRLWNDGRFRVLLFAGDVRDADQYHRLQRFGQLLSEPDSFVNTYTPNGGAFDSLVDVLTIHTADPHEMELHDFPDALHPFDESSGWSYDKIFSEGTRIDGRKTYEYYGIDGTRGCVMVVRPDHHVGWIGEFEDVKDIEGYFAGIFNKQR